MKALSLLLMLLIPSLQSCKKFIEVDLPIDSSTSESVFASVGSSVLALNSIYGVLSNNGDALLYGTNGITICSGLLSDELKSPYLGYYTNSLKGGESTMWDKMYRLVIYRANAAINGISASIGIQGQTKISLLAEAKFLRAFAYFNLVNYYGDVPLVLSTDFIENSNIPRSPVSKIYDQIISDLLEAKTGLNDTYIAQNMTSTSLDRIRANKAVATALLARVYLYRERWSEAEENANLVIADSKYTLLDDLNLVFLKNSEETIWALQPNPLLGNGGNPNTPDGRAYFPMYSPTPYYLSEGQINVFDIGDKRLLNWVTKGTNNLGEEVIVPFKYKKGESIGQPPQEEYTMVLRLAEQYLIRAEARAKLGNLDGALLDLNKIRIRAGLNEVALSNQVDILNSIFLERQRELFSEGHRWLDLKRTGRIDQVMSVAVTKKIFQEYMVTWEPFKALLPIPWSEFKLNPALRGHQNIGYTEQ